MLLGPFILRLIMLILACTFAYRSYVAFRLAYTDSRSAALDPKGTSPYLGRVVWGLTSLAISLGLFFYLIYWLMTLAKF